MLTLIIYIITAICFIGAIVLFSFIPSKAVKVMVLILFCLLFIGAMTFLLFKVSGYEDLGSMFEALTLKGGKPVEMP